MEEAVAAYKLHHSPARIYLTDRFPSVYKNIIVALCLFLFFAILCSINDCKLSFRGVDERNASIS